MMTQNASGPPLRPGQYRLFDLAVKIASIEFRKEPFEIINLTVGRRDYFATALPSSDVRCPQKLGTESIRTIDALLVTRRFPRKQTRHQQERQCPNHFRRRRLEKIRKPHVDATG